MANIFLIGVFAAIAINVAAISTAKESWRCRLSPMSFTQQKSLIKVDSFNVKIEGPDSKTKPTAWEGPLLIRDNSNDKMCTVNSVSLINRPLLAFDRRFLVLVTYSGSNFRVVTVDLKSCRIAGTSGNLTGPISFHAGRVVANGVPINGFPCPILKQKTSEGRSEHPQ